jgi:hypothetical protein
VTEHDELRLDPTHGQRTGGPPGERLVVGLAALALFAGVLIALGNLIGHEAEAGSASPSPSRPTPSASPSPTGLPSARLLREMTVERAVPVPSLDDPVLFNGWVRATADTIIRANPEPDAIQLALLAQGAVAFAEEVPEQPPGELGWLHLAAPDQGWVATAEGGNQLVERLAYPPVPVSGDIWALAAGDRGFVAVGQGAGMSDENSRALIASSADGRTWEVGEPPAGPNDGFVVASGPAGWIALTVEGHVDRTGPGETAWAWRSTDGLSWAALGRLAGEPGMYPSAIVSSDAGYLLAMAEGNRPQQSSFWFSEDGITWRETADSGLSDTPWLRLSGGPSGFYAWNAQGNGAGEPSRSAFSANSRTWSPVTTGPEGPYVQVAAVGDGWVGTDVEVATGVRRLWAGEVKGNRLAWRREPGEAAFSGAVVTTLVSDGRRAVAFGWDRGTERPLAWIRDGSSWTRSPLPDGFGGIPRIAAAGPTGVVVVGYRPTSRGQNPVLWHLEGDSSWAPEPAPILPELEDPGTDQCGPPPSTAVDFVVLDHAAAVGCLGAAPVTFRAWSVRCFDCFGPAYGSGTPAWLATPGANQLALSPIETTEGYWSSVVLDPAVPRDPSWAGAWLEVTGHFDDPGAQACRLTLSTDDELYYSGRQSIVDGCRQQFVVTAVTPVGGP